MRLAEWQTRMQRALLAGNSDPEWLARLADAPEQRERRLAVYRNNVHHALTSVLEAAFPVIRQLIGVECFTATTLTFIARHPPLLPTLYAYGGDFPEFLAGFPALAELRWLADVARLEWARNEALFAAEADSLTPAELANLPAAELPGLQLGLHPTARRLRSPWPIHSIWVAHQHDGGPLEAVDLTQGEAVLVWRWDGTVCQRRLKPGEFTLLAAFAAQRPLVEAAEAGAAQDPTFDLTGALARLLADGALVRPT